MKSSNAHFLSKYSNDAIFISLSAEKTNSMLMMSYDTWLFLFSLYLLCEEVVMESEWIIKSSSKMKKKNHWIHHWKGIEWWTGRGREREERGKLKLLNVDAMFGGGFQSSEKWHHYIKNNIYGPFWVFPLSHRL